MALSHAHILPPLTKRGSIAAGEEYANGELRTMASGQGRRDNMPWQRDQPAADEQAAGAGGSRWRWRLFRREQRDSGEVSTYALPRDAKADQLLDFQHFFLKRLLGRSHQAPLRNPARILDVGCGTGRWAVEMAAEFPSAQVVGFDLVAPVDAGPLLATLGKRARNVSFVQGDLLTGLPFPDSAFDYVHLRLLYSDLPADRWPAVVRELARVTRPGGWVECVEPAEAIRDASPAYGATAHWIAEMCRRRGLDPNVGPQLKSLLVGAGLVQVSERTAMLAANATRGHERRLLLTQVLGVLEVLREPILETGVVSAADYERTLPMVKREYEQGDHANADVLHIVYGQRLPM